MKIGLETESMHLWFQNHYLNILGFIDFAKEYGFNGVIINIIKDYGLDEEWGCLGDNNLNHLQKIKTKLEEYNMYCEIDSKGFDKQKFLKIAKVAEFLGAKIIRSYVPVKATKKPKKISQGLFDESKIDSIFDKQAFLKSSKEILELIPILEDFNLKLAIENHEYQTSNEILELINIVNHKNVGVLFDFGNSMMAYEDPVIACKNLAKYTFSTHCKDHIIFKEDGIFYVCGTPLNEGNIDIKSCIEILKTHGLEAINIEQCYPYCTTFKRPIGTGGIKELGKGSFKIKQPLFKNLKALSYYYPQEISNEILQNLLILQKQGVEKSIKYLKRIL